MPQGETNLIISSDFINNLNCRHIAINANNEFVLSDIMLTNHDNYINIDSFSSGNQMLIFNTNYNDVLSEQINFTININVTNLLGDLNYDGQINVVDVIIVINMILEEQFNSLADINEDEAINIMDVVLLVNLILNN